MISGTGSPDALQTIFPSGLLTGNVLLYNSCTRGLMITSWKEELNDVENNVIGSIQKRKCSTENDTIMAFKHSDWLKLKQPIRSIRTKFLVLDDFSLIALLARSWKWHLSLNLKIVGSSITRACRLYNLKLTIKVINWNGQLFNAGKYKWSTNRPCYSRLR